MNAQRSAALLYQATAAVAALPWSWLRAGAHALAGTMQRTGMREAKVAGRNLQIAFPQMPAQQRADMLRAVLVNTATQAMETLRLWTRPHAQNLAWIVESEGTELFDAAIAAGGGVIVAAPHHGNWELLNQWLAWRTPLAILYKPPQSAVGEAFLRRVRADSDRVTQVRAEAQGIRQLFKVLKAGGVVGILPDQQPKAGDGEFAPFFGTQALTMTLLGRLAERSRATVLFAWCERLPDDGADGPRFALRFRAAPEDIGAPDPARAVHALNQGLEAVVAQAPAQYQWTYKRYTLRPPDSGQTNPYRDLEGRRARNDPKPPQPPDAIKSAPDPSNRSDA